MTDKYTFLILQNEQEYKNYFVHNYCQSPLVTVHGLSVRFSASTFDHAFYESSDRNGAKDIFSRPRAERIGWIAHALQDPKADWFCGWDNKKRRYDSSRGVCVVRDDFVTVIKVLKNHKAKFVTCYRADNSISKIRKSPIWTPPPRV